MVHSATSIALSRVTNSDVFAIWKVMEAKKRHVRVAKIKNNVGQPVRISREKIIFPKGAEQISST